MQIVQEFVNFKRPFILYEDFQMQNKTKGREHAEICMRVRIANENLFYALNEASAREDSKDLHTLLNLLNECIDLALRDKGLNLDDEIMLYTCLALRAKLDWFFKKSKFVFPNVDIYEFGKSIYENEKNITKDDIEWARAILKEKA